MSNDEIITRELVDEYSGCLNKQKNSAFVWLLFFIFGLCDNRLNNATTHTLGF